MVTAAFLDVLTLIIGAILDGLPKTEVPDWVNSASNFIPTVFNFAGSMGVWFPWATLSIVIAAVVVVWSGSFVFKVVRIIISHVTGGGGSAA